MFEMFNKLFLNLEIKLFLSEVDLFVSSIDNLLKSIFFLVLNIRIRSLIKLWINVGEFKFPSVSKLFAI